MGPTKEKWVALETRMKEVGIRLCDVEERFIKSSGRGGQKVNKTSSAVFLKHIPTAITVKCQAERSQALNRFLALRRLVDKVAQAQGLPGAGDREAAVRKQKQKRRKRSRSKHQSPAATAPDDHP